MERSGRQTGGAGVVLRRVLKDNLAAQISGEVRGEHIAETRAHLVDLAIKTMFAAIEARSGRADFVVLATGGYGRGMLAPESDVDLLFLHDQKTDDSLRPSVDALLYPLWDAGLTIGQGVHTTQSAMALARDDIAALTSFLDARLICGSARLAATFFDAYGAYRKRHGASFTRAKLAEREARYATQRENSGWIEPNLKEGRGGLRDADLVGWLYRFQTGKDLWARTQAPGFIEPRDLRSLKKARKYLWAVRVYLHTLNARADDNVRFDIQPALADALGYDDRRHIAAPERVLKHLRLNSDIVFRITNIVTARMEERYARLSKLAPRAMPRRLVKDEIPGDVNIRFKTNRLTFSRPALARRRPIDLMRIVRAASKRPDLEIHPDAIEIMVEGAAAMSREDRDDEQIKQIFLAILEKGKAPFRTFRLLSDTGLLAKLIPMFGRISGRIEYGLYRRYSIEDQVFHCLEMLRRLEKGELEGKHPIATAFLKGKKNRLRFYLTVLLQEVYWADTERSVSKAEGLAFRIAKRFVDAQTAKDIAWCAANPDAMIAAAETRDLSLRRSVERFALKVGSKDRLDVLLILTVCRIRTISEDSWDEWTRGQISALYFGARAVLSGGTQALETWRAEEREALKTNLSGLLSQWPQEKLDTRLADISGSVGARVPPDVLARGLQLVDEVPGAAVGLWPRDGFFEAIVLAPDRIGLLANLALAASQSGTSVRMLQAMSVSDGRALDFFVLKPLTPVPPEAQRDFLAELHRALNEAAAVNFEGARAPSRRLRDRRMLFSVPSEVRIDHEADEDSLLVEAEGRDRPGLLGQLATALSEIGVMIKSAHVATYGERAVDAFYLQDAPGYKITNKRRIQSIERRILGVLNEH